MQAITKVFSDIVKPYIDATDNGLINNDFTNGAVNLFPVTATTQTVNGITFTVNSDGTITANGTSTTDFSFSLYGTAGNRLFDTGVLQKGKSYKISGTPSGMPTTVYMYLNTSDGATRDNGDGAIINSTSSTTGGNFAIVVNAANVTLNNVIFKPMITVADMPDSDYAHYVPYAMSNQELTSENQTLQNQIDVLNADGNWRTGLRFKNLGTSFTSAQATALANGDFSEFWNGDYWVINSQTWRIVDNSGWARRRGDTNFDSNSLVIMPDYNLVTAEAYLIDGGTSGSNTDTHGYASCGYRTDEKSGKGRTQCKTLFQNAFGSSHVASHRELMSTSRGTGGALSWAWQDADVELPSEVNIYGHSVWGSGLESGVDEPSYNIGDRWGQFMLFRLSPYIAINRGQNYWLRDIHSASYFAHVLNLGRANCSTPSDAHVGLRPYSIII